MKALLIGLQLIGDSQLKPQLDNPAFTGPFAKSNLSRAYFQTGVASLDKFYEAMDLESYLPEDKDWIKNWVGGAWRTLRASDGAGGRVSSVDRVDAPKIRKVFDIISELKKLAGGEMAAAAGLTVGFNELDGD